MTEEILHEDLLDLRVNHPQVLQGVPQKMLPCLEGPSTPKFWARNKSRGCFGILRFSTFQNLNSSSRKKYYLQLHHLKRCHGLLYPRHQHGLLHPWHWHGHHYPWHRHALHHLQHCIVMVTTNITEHGRQRCCSSVILVIPIKIKTLTDIRTIITIISIHNINTKLCQSNKPWYFI